MKKINFTEKTTAPKRVVALLLSVLFCIGGFSIAAYASTSRSQPILGFSYGASLMEHYYISEYDEPWDLEIYPGQEIRIPLTADMFEWGDGRTVLPNEAITLQELKRSRVQVKTQVRAGSETLDYVQLNTDVFPGRPFLVPGQNRSTGKTGYISIKFTDKLVSTDPVPFDFDLVLTVNRDRNSDFTLRLSGVMQNDEIEVHRGMDYVKLYDNMVAIGDDYQRSVAFDVGAGVTVHKHVLFGERYYGFTTVVDEMSILREEFPEIYPTVAGVYRLNTVNLQYGNEGVTIKPQFDPDKPEITKYYVYNEDLEYLGTTNDKLYYSDMYILTTEKLPDMQEALYEEGLISPPTQQRA